MRTLRRLISPISVLVVLAPYLLVGSLVVVASVAAPPLMDHAEAQDSDQLPGDRTNNRTKWVLLGIGGLALVGLGGGLMGWKKRIEIQQSKTDERPPPPIDAAPPTGPPEGDTRLAAQPRSPATDTAAPASPPVGATPLPHPTRPPQVTQASSPPVADHTPLPPAKPTADPLHTGAPPTIDDPPLRSMAVRPEDATEEPVWDDTLGVYVQWDPVDDQWLVFDQITQAWRVKD